MYIQKISIQNIRSISQLEWELAATECAGWHVLIGDNGSGKSTVLRAIALALVGPQNAYALRQNWDEWLRRKEYDAKIVLDLVDAPDFDIFQGKGATGKKKALKAIIKLHRTKPLDGDGYGEGRGNGYSNGSGTHFSDVSLSGDSGGSKPTTDRHVWSNGSGWFSAAYGPFRRFAGGNQEYSKLFYSYPRLAAHLSIFGEDVALSEAVEWLKELRYKSLENRLEGELLGPITKFINQEGFLPYQAKLKEISSTGVLFTDANENTISVENLSDGYRSILSMTFELIRQLQITYSNQPIFSTDGTQVILPGVVLIDEIDAHLHPTWQKRVGLWFRQHFPNIQFIVTTHSPLVCQAAEHGSVWKLPRPGTDEQCFRVQGHELERLLFGDLVEAYSTHLFGMTTTRSDDSKHKIERLAELNLKETFVGLTAYEQEEQSVLRAMLPTLAGITEATR